MNLKIGNRNSAVYNMIIHISLAVFSLICIMPVLLIVVISFMQEKEILIKGYTFIPDKITFNAYKTVVGNPIQLVNAYSVTVFVTVIGTLAGLWLTSTLAYVLTRKNYRFKRKLSFFVFFTMVFNGGLVPSYIMIASWFHMKDSFLVLMLPYLCVAWNVLLMKGLLQNIPESLIESAKIDGARELVIFIKIILPVSKPAIATVGLFIAFSYWNDWFQSMMYIDSNNKIMLQYLLVRILQNIEFLNSDFARSVMRLEFTDIPTYSARMAMCVIAAGPMMFLFPFFQKYFAKGLTIGSVKG